MSIKQTSPKHVVTIAGLQEALELGWQLHVVCRLAPELRGYQWYGSWYLVAVDPETQEWAVLVTAREHAKELSRIRTTGSQKKRAPDDVSFREIKTLSGLVNMLTSLGFKSVGLPTEPGSSLVLER